MSQTYRQLVAVLTKYISETNVNVALTRALRETRTNADALTAERLPELIPIIQRSARLFLDPSGQRALDHQLRALADGKAPALTPQRVTIATERDITEARQAARTLCERLGARAFAMQKVATAVSELARNVVNYTPGGFIEVTAAADPPPRVLVWACDRGSGIKNLDDIMTGHYRSRTGLGMGLKGVKRLSDRFEVQTGSDGTNVRAEVLL